jgi:hypothetical protein
MVCGKKEKENNNNNNSKKRSKNNKSTKLCLGDLSSTPATNHARGDTPMAKDSCISGLIDLTYAKTYKNSSQTTYTLTVAMVTTTS